MKTTRSLFLAVVLLLAGLLGLGVCAACAVVLTVWGVWLWN